MQIEEQQVYHNKREEELIKLLDSLIITKQPSPNLKDDIINFKEINQSDRMKQIIKNEKNCFDFLDSFCKDEINDDDYVNENQLKDEIANNEISKSLITQTNLYKESINNFNDKMDIEIEDSINDAQFNKRKKHNKLKKDLNNYQ